MTAPSSLRRTALTAVVELVWPDEDRMRKVLLPKVQPVLHRQANRIGMPLMNRRVTVLGQWDNWRAEVNDDQRNAIDLYLADAGGGIVVLFFMWHDDWSA